MRFNCGAMLISLLGLIALRAEGQARVRVHVADAYGNSLPAQRITLTDEGGTTIETTQDEVFSAKYGKYTLKVSVQGFSNAVDVFAIDQPEQILSITMKLGVMEIPSPSCSIGGRVIPESGITRIRLLQLFGPNSIDVPVVVGGSFRFQNLECGDYMLIAMGPNACVATKMSRATTSGARADLRVSELGGGACGAGRNDR